MNDFIKISDILRYEIKLKDDNGNVDSYIPVSKIKSAVNHNVRENIESYWTLNETEDNLKYSFTCNNCNQKTKESAFIIAPDFCPYCGAEMKQVIRKN
jgi:Zn finger protein HypA/HybF involved in hydrogenase expression